MSYFLMFSLLHFDSHIYHWLKKKVGYTQSVLRRCVYSKSQFLEKSEMVSIHHTVSPFTWYIFDKVVTNLIPMAWNDFSSNPIFFLHCLLPFQKEFLLCKRVLTLILFLQGNPRVSVVTMLITWRVISTDRPFTIAVEWVLVRGMSERTKSLATSSSYLLIISNKPIQLCLVKISTIGGC